MVTKGHRARRLGRAIAKLEGSIELSSKESHAKEQERKYKEQTKREADIAEDYPVEDLRDRSNRRKEQT